MKEEFLRTWLSHQEWWFDKSHDTQIVNEWGSIILSPTFSNTHTPMEIAAHIIAYDQLPRHIFRVAGDQGANHMISYYLHTQSIPHLLRLIGVSEPFQITYKRIKDVFQEEIDPNLLCFLLLPLRHTERLEEIMTTTRVVWSALKDKSNSAVYKRSLKAAYSRTSHSCLLNSTMNLSEYFPHPELKQKAIDWYLDYYYVLDPYSIIKHGDNPDPDVCLKEFKNSLKGYSFGAINISLSGGVDSMVCSKLAVDLYGPENVTCIHINYCNRETSDHEEQFIIEWCTRVLGCRLIVRRIKEINRPECMEYDMRECYETYTKRVRFATYKGCSRALPQSLETRNHAIMGHNKDDCLENILTNIKGKGHFDRLTGMEKETYIKDEDVTLIRPLLNVSKHDIKAYARAKSIPYLYDSTQSWSQRGIIRKSVVPALTSWSGDNFARGAFDLAETMRDLYCIFDAFIDGVKFHRLEEDKETVETHLPFSATSSPLIMSSSLLWRGLIKKAQNVLEVPQKDRRVSQKCLRTLVERIRARTEKVHESVHVVAELSSTMRLYTHKSGLVRIQYKKII